MRFGRPADQVKHRTGPPPARPSRAPDSRGSRNTRSNGGTSRKQPQAALEPAPLLREALRARSSSRSALSSWTTTRTVIGMARLLLGSDDPASPRSDPEGTLPPAPQRTHDVDPRAAAQRDRCRTRLSGLAGAVRVLYDYSGMGQNFISCDRGQSFLLPPSLTDWLAEDHPVWTVLGAVEQMNLDGFYRAYRANGQGRAAYDPAMMGLRFSMMGLCFFCTRTRAGIGPRGRSSGRVVGMWRSR